MLVAWLRASCYYLPHIMEILMRSLSIGRMLRPFGAVTLLLVCCAVPAIAGKLVLEIRVGNPSDETKTVPIRSSLPERITSDDIIDDGGLNIGYDVKSDTYYVHDTVQLAPRVIDKVFRVTMRDIWVIDQEQLDAYRKRAGVLADALSGSEYSKESGDERSKIEKRSEEILARQDENGITSVSPISHIQAYESNMKVLTDLKQSVGRMENLAMSAGVNPGDYLIGDDLNAAIPRRDIHFPEQYGEAIVKITVSNSSSTRARTVDVRREMPPEISIDDVLDAGGLAVRYDARERLTYVFKDDVEVPANDSVTFEVRIRDKWNVNADRIAFLHEKANALIVVTSGRDNIEAVENTLNGALETLGNVAKEVGPETLSPSYIAFYRRQADRLDDVERELNRVDSALKPLDTKRGFDMPAPDKKTTWLIIYIILGFLALVSLLFFLRWYVRSS